MFTRLTRRTLVAVVTAALAGCGGGGGKRSPAEDNPAIGDVDQQGTLRLTSSAFEDGEAIPERYGRGAENVNPPLSIEGVPGEATSLVLIVDDPDSSDVPGKAWLHWLVWNIPPSTQEIPEGWSPGDAVVGKNDFGTRGYGGPAPPGGTHRYRFKLYALDTTLDLSESAGRREVGTAMRGHVSSATQLSGTYSA